MTPAATSGHHKTTTRCYHCGGELPLGNSYQAHVAGRPRAVCSERCQQTADWIESTGLADFYRLRSGPSKRPENANNAASWQSPELLAHVVRDAKGGLKEVSLLVDGMHCAGCAWLIERALLQLGGVSNIRINPVTHRALLAFDPRQVDLAAILDTLTQAGYTPRPLQSAALDDARTHETRDLMKRLLVAGFGMMQVMTFAFVIYMNNINKLPGGTLELFRWLGFLVATPVVFYAAIPFFKGARQALRLKSLNMDVPIAIAIAAIYGASVFQAVTFGGEVYFDSVSMLVFFLLTGRYLEMRARHRSVDSADALIHLTPAFAERRRDDGTLEKVAVDDLVTGDRVQVAEGAYVPADGQLISAQALLDESLLSGEANACKRLKSESIIAGSLVLEGPLELLVTRIGGDTFLATLAQLSTQAQTERPKLASRNQKATARFVLRVLVLTGITLAGWLIYDPAQALEATIAVLVVACPCALGLAAPAAITRALGVLARHNILVVRPAALDTLTQVNHAVFDKTGTLTEPSLNTRGVDATTLQLAASLARESQHPLSRALVAANRLPLLAVDAAQSFPGMGLEGVVNGRALRLGQARFVLDDTALSHQDSTDIADSSLVLGENGHLLARFDMDERLRDDAYVTLTTLATHNISCELVSGDSLPRVERIATQLNSPPWHGRMQPAAKLEHLKQQRLQGMCVLAVGDGSNDAPVLAGADVSVALTSGAELAQANADILLCSGQLAGLVTCRHVAFETQKILRQNEHWAITYNTLAMPLAALGFIPPWLAAIFMSASSLVVVLNALRIGKHLPASALPQAISQPDCCQPASAEIPAESPAKSNCCATASKASATPSCCNAKEDLHPQPASNAIASAASSSSTSNYCKGSSPDMANAKNTGKDRQACHGKEVGNTTEKATDHCGCNTDSPPSSRDIPALQQSKACCKTVEKTP